MGLRTWFGEQDDGVKVLLVVVFGFVAVVGFVVFTVVAAAVLGTFVLGIEPSSDQIPPTTSFSFHEEGSAVEIVHDGDESFAADQVEVVVDDEIRGTWAALDPDASAGENVVEGDSVTVSGVASGDTITIRWLQRNGGEPVTMAVYEVP